MTYWFVSRHPGAQQWAREHNIKADRWIEHLDLDQIQPGDVIAGTLPVDKVAEINARGARFLALCLDLKQADRGKELSSDDMSKLNGRLVEYQVQKLESKDWEKDR